MKRRKYPSKKATQKGYRHKVMDYSDKRIHLEGTNKERLQARQQLRKELEDAISS